MTRSVMPAPALGLNALGQLARLLIDVVRALRDRREVMHLTEFDERMLKDIGLTHSDVHSALAGPIHRRPSWILVRCTNRPSRSEIMTPARPQIRPVVPTVLRAERCAH